MIATVDDVFEITGYTVNEESVKHAQAIVEVYAGRPESLINNVTDLEWMRYAISWQVAYMDFDPKSVFEQANVKSYHANDTVMDFGDKAYQIAPLAQKAVGRLSWNRSRSIKTGNQYPLTPEVGWEYA